MAMVRSGVSAVSRVVVGAELIQGAIAPADVLVAQLPRVAGERWVALPFNGTSPEAELSMVCVSSGVVDFTKPVAGVFCDAWPELVPNREETTGVAFHFDAPGARPPQAALIVPAPFLPNMKWSLSALLSTVFEARYLTVLRGVSPADLRWFGTVLPAICTPFSFSNDVPAVKLDNLAAKYASANAATASILGKA
jgi:hypothetical protein